MRRTPLTSTIVLGADSIYLAEQIEPLMDALRQLCASQTLVLLALERRSPDVWQRFDEALRGQFRVREVPLQCLEKAMAHSAVPGAARGRVDRLAVLLCQMCSASPDILLNEDIQRADRARELRGSYRRIRMR